ncbi:hypothetical protein [Pseudomonas aeruginosa]|uniref:hypothetical protein n=1 Tax=Pseudomonas aeruginosa TaxID=287 RepID=UPI0009859371|nr:hypothetical protein [Pseudomonas aeruginosa]OOK45091.1 hypothetical protein BM548_31250 [Pseudomonas aeruginosa]
MDSEEPPNVRVACSGDIDEVVRLMHDAAAWMSAKGTPAWDVARIDRTQGCAKLRLDCHPNLRGLYERLGFTHVDTFNPGWDPTFIAERLELEI